MTCTPIKQGFIQYQQAPTVSSNRNIQPGLQSPLAASPGGSAATHNSKQMLTTELTYIT